MTDTTPTAIGADALIDELDAAGTATVEDGSIAKLALSGHVVRFEDEDAIAPSEQAPAQAAPAAVAGPLDELEELSLLNRLIELGAKAAHAHAKSNSDDGHAGTKAYVQWQELRAEMGELIRKAYAAPTTKAAPMESVLIDGVAYQTPAPVAAELLRLHIDARQAASQQEAREPCSTCAALARTVMFGQVSFDRKPDCYGIRQITDDEGVEEWEDIRTSPDVAREEANDMMATGRGETYEVVPLYTAPQPAPVAQGDALPREDFAWLVVQEACETEPADEDDPECIRILRRDLKSAVLAAFLRHDAARTQAKEGAIHE